MMHPDWLHRVASADQKVRRGELLAILDELGAVYDRQVDQIRQYRPENIVVSFHDGGPRYVIGAHYDSVPDSTGANDNAAGVCIVLALIRKCLKEPPPIPLDFVFFDLEEGPMAGSQAYIQWFGNKVPAMINLDLCGVGDTLLLALSDSAIGTRLEELVQGQARSGQYPIQLVDTLPPGDDMIFEHAGIPTVATTMVPAADVPLMIESALKIHQFDAPSVLPSVFETMHNRSRDSLTTVEDSAMQIVLRWSQDLISALGALDEALK